MVPLGEGHLRRLVYEYIEHDHRERNHQGLDNQLLQRPPPPRRPDAGRSAAGYASEDYSVSTISTIERPHEGSTDKRTLRGRFARILLALPLRTSTNDRTPHGRITPCSQIR